MVDLKRIDEEIENEKIKTSQTFNEFPKLNFYGCYSSKNYG